MGKRQTIVCPECEVVLRPEQVQAHLSYHWGDDCPDSLKFPEANERYMVLYHFAKGAGVVFQHRDISL